MNKYIRVIKNFCADKTIRFSYLTKLGVFNGLSDEQYLKLKYKMYSAEILIWKIRRRSMKTSVA